MTTWYVGPWSKHDCSSFVQLLKNFAKEFTKKTKVTLDLPCGEDAPAADKRAEAKLRLAVEHTKRSLSASTGAATCAVVSDAKALRHHGC